MQSRLLDRDSKSDFAAAEQGYWDLFDPAIACAPGFTTPSLDDIKRGKFDLIMCYEGEELVGLMCIRLDNYGVYYPVMRGDYAAVLGNMCAFAQETYPRLTAQTENEFIHELAIRSGQPFDYDENHVIIWSK